MKKVLLTATALFAFGFANAQEVTETPSEGFSKGNVMISGGIGFGLETQGNMKNSDFHFTPKAGYFFTDHIVAGLNLGYRNAKRENEPTTPNAKVKANIFTYGVFGRYYITPTNKFSFFGELGVNAFSNETTVTSQFPGPIYTNKGKLKGFNAGFAPGVSYFISKNLALETSIGLLQYATDKDDSIIGAESRDSFDIGLDLSNITFGLVYKF